MRKYNIVTGLLGMTETFIEEIKRFKKWLKNLMKEQLLIEWKGLSSYHTYLAKLYVFSKRQRYHYPRYNRRPTNDGDLKVPLKMMMPMFMYAVLIII